MGNELRSKTATVKKVILLFEGRTGSSLFGGLMNQHPNICFLGEELAEIKDQGWHAQQIWMDKYFDPDSGFTDVRRNKEKLKILGFKIKLRDIADPTRFREYILANDIQIIHMYRKNIVKQTLSSIRAMDLARSHGVYNLDASQAEKIPGKYRIPLQHFNNILLWITGCEWRLREFIASLGDSLNFRMSYEELISDIQGMASNVFCKLRVKPVAVKPVLIKITSDNMEDAIENYAEIKGFYSDSVLAGDFD